MPLFHRTPEKFEAKALEYDRKSKPMKAQKNREKAANLRAQSQGNLSVLPAGQWGSTNYARSPALYEQNALKWEQRGNLMKAQKNREKYWRAQNPQYAQYAAPTFYQNNSFLGYNQPYGTALQTTTTTTGFAAPVVEHIVRPTIVEQTMRAERILEVQPVIHREIDAPQVRVVEKHMYETVPSTGPSTITNAPIIQETVRPHIIEEVQPVVHREVPAPFVERVEQHVTEHIVQPTVTTKEVINDTTIHTTTPLTTTTTTSTTQQQQQHTGGIMGKVQNAMHHNQQH